MAKTPKKAAEKTATTTKVAKPKLTAAYASTKPKTPSTPKAAPKPKAADKTAVAAKKAGTQAAKPKKAEPKKAEPKSVLKQTSEAISTLASDILHDRIVPTIDQIKSLAASALSQDETKSKRAKPKKKK